MKKGRKNINHIRSKVVTDTVRDAMPKKGEMTSTDVTGLGGTPELVEMTGTDMSQAWRKHQCRVE